jgi:hypothetical protein
MRGFLSCKESNEKFLLFFLNIFFFGAPDLVNFVLEGKLRKNIILYHQM